jgi:hypothetical protein
MAGGAGANYVTEASSDLINWVPLDQQLAQRHFEFYRYQCRNAAQSVLSRDDEFPMIHGMGASWFFGEIIGIP